MSEPPAASARRTQPSSAPNVRWARHPRAAQASPGASGVEDHCVSIPLRRSRIGVIDEASVAMCEQRDLGHLVFAPLVLAAAGVSDEIAQPDLMVPGPALFDA